MAFLALKLLDTLPYDDGTYRETRHDDPPIPVPDPQREHHEARAEAILAGSRAGYIPEIYDAFNNTAVDPLVVPKTPYGETVRERFGLRDQSDAAHEGLSSSTYPHPDLIPKKPFRARDMPWPPPPGKEYFDVAHVQVRARRQSEPMPSPVPVKREKVLHQQYLPIPPRQRQEAELQPTPVLTPNPLLPAAPLPETLQAASDRVISASPAPSFRTAATSESAEAVGQAGIRSQKRSMGKRIKDLIRVKSKLQKRR